MLDKVASDQALVVLSPVAERFGAGNDPITPRLPTLSGKTVGLLWNGKPNGGIALETVRDTLLAAGKDIKFNFYSGSVPHQAKLLDKVAAECDAVITCTADCGGCASWTTHDSIQLERRKVPTVILASHGYQEDIEATAQAFSMPGIKFAVTPKIYNNITEDEAREQTVPIVDELVELLTLSPARGAAVGHSAAGLPTLTFRGAGSEAAYFAFNEAFNDKDWGDGYPLTPPTEERVAELLTGIDGSPDDLVCYLPPGNGAATARAVAVNAAMAGCRPAEMPIIMAALRSIAKNEAKHAAVRVSLMSTSAEAPLVMVGGPIAKEVGINTGRAPLGPGKQNIVNIRIGRAILFCLKNIGRLYLGVMDMDAIGTPRKNIAVMAENMDESPWESYQAARGFSDADNTVTVFFTSGEWDIALQGSLGAEQLAKAIGSYGAMSSAGYFAGMMGAKSEDDRKSPLGRLLFLAPPHAQLLSEGGFSKQKFEQSLFDSAREPISRLIEPIRKLHKDGKLKQEWEWLFDLSDEEARSRTLPVLESPDLFSVVVAGSARGKHLLMPLRARPFTEPVTRKPAGI